LAPGGGVEDGDKEKGVKEKWLSILHQTKGLKFRCGDLEKTKKGGGGTGRSPLLSLKKTGVWVWVGGKPRGKKKKKKGNPLGRVLQNKKNGVKKDTKRINPSATKIKLNLHYLY